MRNISFPKYSTFDKIKYSRPTVPSDDGDDQIFL